MRRSLVILIAAALFIGTGLITLSFAQGMNRKMEKGMMKSDMMAQKCPTHGMMIKAVMEKSMIAATDGGVIVLAGNKLIKYDKDLNVVKEVEIKIDMEAMQKNMMEMMKDCPMRKGAMMGACMAGNNPEQNTPPASGAEVKSEQQK